MSSSVSRQHCKIGIEQLRQSPVLQNIVQMTLLGISQEDSELQTAQRARAGEEGRWRTSSPVCFRQFPHYQKITWTRIKTASDLGQLENKQAPDPQLVKELSLPVLSLQPPRNNDHSSSSIRGPCPCPGTCQDRRLSSKNSITTSGCPQLLFFSNEFHYLGPTLCHQ